MGSLFARFCSAVQYLLQRVLWPEVLGADVLLQYLMTPAPVLFCCLVCFCVLQAAKCDLL